MRFIPHAVAGLLTLAVAAGAQAPARPQPPTTLTLPGTAPHIPRIADNVKVNSQMLRAGTYRLTLTLNDADSSAAAALTGVPGSANPATVTAIVRRLSGDSVQVTPHGKPTLVGTESLGELHLQRPANANVRLDGTRGSVGTFTGQFTFAMTPAAHGTFLLVPLPGSSGPAGTAKQGSGCGPTATSHGWHSTPDGGCDPGTFGQGQVGGGTGSGGTDTSSGWCSWFGWFCGSGSGGGKPDGGH